MLCEQTKLLVGDNRHLSSHSDTFTDANSTPLCVSD